MRNSGRSRSGSGQPRTVKGYLLLGLAVLTCPCHLPLLLAVLAGTGLAGALSQHFGLAFLLLSVIFVASLRIPAKLNTQIGPS
jgi:mercuric ion transport protein